MVIRTFPFYTIQAYAYGTKIRENKVKFREFFFQLSFVNDQFPRVRAELLRVITRCLKDIKSVPMR